MLKKERLFVAITLAIILGLGIYSIRFAELEGNGSILWQISQGYPLFYNVIPYMGHYGPVLPYMMKIPFLIYNHPYMIFLTLVVLHTASSLIIYKIGKEFFDTKTGIFALLLYGFSQFTLQNQLLGWPSNFTPFFALLFFYSAYQIKFNKNTRYYIVLFFSAGVLLQLHVSAFSSIPFLVIFFLFRPKINLKHIFLGLFIFLIVFSPYIYYEIANGFQETGERIQSLTSSEVEATIGPQEIDKNLFISVLGHHVLYPRLMNGPYYKTFSYLIALVFILVMISKAGLKQMLSKHLLLALIVLPSLALLIRFPYLYPPHFNFVFPPIILIISLIFSSAPDLLKKPKALSKTASICVYLLVLYIIIMHLSYFISINNEKKVNGLPFEAQLKIAERISEYGAYGDIYTLDLEMTTREGINPLLINLYNKNMVFDEGINTIVTSEIAQDYSKNSLCDDKQVNLPYKSYRLLNCPSLIKKDGWRYTQEFKKGWFEKSFNDNGWNLVEMPIQLCLGNDLLDGCSNIANFDSFYIRGKLRLPNKGKYLLVIQDLGNTHMVSEAYINGVRMSLPSTNRFGEVILPLEEGIIQEENILAIFLELREGRTAAKTRMMAYNAYAIPKAG